MRRISWAASLCLPLPVDKYLGLWSKRRKDVLKGACSFKHLWKSFHMKIIKVGSLFHANLKILNSSPATKSHSSVAGNLFYIQMCRM